MQPTTHVDAPSRREAVNTGLRFALFVTASLGGIALPGCGGGSGSSSPTNDMNATVRSQIATSEANRQANAQLISAGEQIIIRQANGTLSVKPSVEVPVDVQQFVNVSVTETNTLVQSSQVTVDNSLTVTIITSSSASTSSSSSSSGKAITRGGHSGFRRYWWGFSASFDSSALADIADALNAGAGVTGVIASKNPAAAEFAGTIAGILAIIAATLNYLSRHNKGITIYRPYIGPWWFSIDN